MGLRKLLRLLASAISVLFGMVLAPNIEKLLAAKGWDTYLLNAKLSFLPAIVLGPWVPYVAVMMIAFTAGLWIDSALAKFDGRARKKPKPLVALGRDSLDLGRSMMEAVDSYIRRDATGLVAELNSLMVRYAALDFPFPDPSKNFSPNEAMRAAGYYLIMVGQLLADGHAVAARKTAQRLIERLPQMNFSDDHDRI